MPTLQQTMTPGQIIESHQQQPPVDVVAIAADLGVNVWEMHTLPEGTSGKIFIDPLNGGLSGYSIGIKATDSRTRKRFTVAHEIAHFILHRNKIGDELRDDAMFRSIGLSTWEEVQANRLAADILMPVRLIRQLQSSGLTTAALAQRMDVSEAAMQVRLSYI